MYITRRQFIEMTSAASAGLLVAGRGKTLAFYQTPASISLFETSFRSIDVMGVAAPDPFPAPVTGVTHYTLGIDQFQDAGVCPSLGPTTLRGFNPVRLMAGENNRCLGGIIVARKDSPIQVTFRNNLPNGMHIIPNDLTLMGADLGNSRTSVHFHGGLSPWVSDGGPFAWWDPAGRHGTSFLNNATLNPTAAPNEAEYYYPLRQSARLGWYHDHAVGITRINAYAGIASALIIRDDFEQTLMNRGLPNYLEAGGYELPLIVQDKSFVGPDINSVDPTWSSVSSATTPGSLWYAHVYERDRWKVGGSRLNPPNPSCVPEFFGDTMLVNGTAFPKVTVQARRYRLRFLNASNARFLNLQLYIADGSVNGITLDSEGNPVNAPALCDPNAPGASASVLQIGTEGGFLPYPARIRTNVPFDENQFTGSLIVAPAERPDILVDFSTHVGQSVILYNDAPAPFPMGDDLYDYFPGWNVKGNPVNGMTAPGKGPNSRVVMRFDIVPASGASDAPLTIDTSTNLQPGIEPLLIPYGVHTPPPGVAIRQLTLNETYDAYGRLIQMLGTTAPFGSKNGGFGRPYDSPATETPQAGITEMWEIFNATGDVHPMHFHLVNVQVVNRQPFKASSLGSHNGATFTGAAVPPPSNETGWKETVMMYPGTVTRVIMQFNLAAADIRTAGGVTIATPSSPRTGGAEYVWHCHILEHEEHDMMRPLVVL